MTVYVDDLFEIPALLSPVEITKLMKHCSLSRRSGSTRQQCLWELKEHIYSSTMNVTSASPINPVEVIGQEGTDKVRPTQSFLEDCVFPYIRSVLGVTNCEGFVLKEREIDSLIDPHSNPFSISNLRALPSSFVMVAEMYRVGEPPLSKKSPPLAVLWLLRALQLIQNSKEDTEITYKLGLCYDELFDHLYPILKPTTDSTDKSNQTQIKSPPSTLNTNNVSSTVNTTDPDTPPSPPLTLQDFSPTALLELSSNLVPSDTSIENYIFNHWTSLQKNQTAPNPSPNTPTNLTILQYLADQSLKYLLKAAERGVVDAQYKLSWIYRDDIRTYYSIEEANNWNIKAAESGHAYAQYNLHLFYGRGDGFSKDEQQSVLWLERAAQVDPDAQYRLGWQYRHGPTINHKQAVYWLTKAAEAGHLRAQYSLGLAYSEGEGVDVDHQLSVKWYTKAANQGFVSAQYNLALCYWSGTGIGEDLQMALYWLRKAAEQQDDDALYTLGYCYHVGKGVKPDRKEAMNWFKKSNNAEAYLALGNIYLDGSVTGGVPDYRLAYNSFLIAYQKGDKEAGNTLLEFKKDILNGFISEDWPSSHDLLHMNCKRALAEFFLSVRYGEDQAHQKLNTAREERSRLYVPKELLYHIARIMIQIWPHEEPHTHPAQKLFDSNPLAKSTPVHPP